MLKKMALYTVFGLALLACLSVAPVYGDEAAGVTAQPTVATSASACGQSLDLGFTTEAGVCPATPSWEPTSELIAPSFGLRTCRCSCGQPCKTDADCGGGICSPGITCC